MTTPIDPRVEIGHVHLKVADLERALDFYCGVLGFELTQRMGSGAAFVSADEGTLRVFSERMKPLEPLRWQSLTNR